MINKINSLKDTPLTGDLWKNFSENKRISLVEEIIKIEKKYNNFQVKSADSNGFVTWKKIDSCKRKIVCF